MIPSNVTTAQKENRRWSYKTNSSAATTIKPEKPENDDKPLTIKGFQRRVCLIWSLART